MAGAKFFNILLNCVLITHRNVKFDADEFLFFVFKIVLVIFHITSFYSIAEVVENYLEFLMKTSR